MECSLVEAKSNNRKVYVKRQTLNGSFMYMQKEKKHTSFDFNLCVSNNVIVYCSVALVREELRRFSSIVFNVSMNAQSTCMASWLKNRTRAFTCTIFLSTFLQTQTHT